MIDWRLSLLLLDNWEPYVVLHNRSTYGETDILASYRLPQNSTDGSFLILHIESYLVPTALVVGMLIFAGLPDSDKILVGSTLPTPLCLWLLPILETSCHTVTSGFPPGLLLAVAHCTYEPGDLLPQIWWWSPLM